MKRVLGIAMGLLLVAGVYACETSSNGEQDVIGGDVLFDNGSRDIFVPPDLGPDACTPQCTGKVCGPNGCGGICGTCTEGTCNTTTGQCETCVPQCTGKECGPDGCGSICGTCSEGTCNTTTGMCEDCVPNCTGRQCGSDGCDGTCGTCTGDDTCNTTTGQCQGAACPADEPGSCKNYFECASECPQGTQGNACRQECQSALNSEGNQQYQAFMTCLNTNCASATTDEEFYACLEDLCITQYYNCFWGCTYPNCSTLIGCIIGCQNIADQTARSQCIGNCWGGARPQAQLDLQGAINCNSDACPVCAVANPTPTQEAECDDCWSEAVSNTCMAEWDKCEEYGSDTCGQLWTCYNGCADETCARACVSRSTKTARGLLQNVFDCINDACPDEEGWVECANAALAAECKTDMDACQADTAAN
jgi:hypothetical protein